MQEYTITEASVKLSVTKETLHAWLVDAQIAPRQSTQDKRRKIITQEELQMIAKKHKRRLSGDDLAGALASAAYDDKDLAALLESVNMTSLELAKVTARLSRIERVLFPRPDSHATPPPAPITSYLPPAPVSTPESTYKRSQDYAAPVLREVAPPVDMPVGSMRAVKFARDHGFSPATLKSQLKDQRPDLVTERDQGAKDDRKEQWVSPNQQVGIIALWQSRRAAFHVCTRPDCACRQDA